MNTSNFTFSSCYAATAQETAAKIFASLLIGLAGLVGNVLTIAVVYREKSLHNTVNYLVVNMALSDLVVPLLIIPRVIVNLVQGYDVWNVTGQAGLALCKVFFFVADLSSAVSILSLIFITVDRFCAIMFPLRIGANPLAGRARRFTIALTWLIPAVILFPYFVYFVVSVSYDGEPRCVLQWSEEESKQRQTMNAYITFNCVFFIIIPFILLSVMYSLILLELRKQDRGAMALSQSDKERSTRQRKTRKVIYMALAIVVVFGVCWGPYNANAFATTFHVWEWDAQSCTVNTFLFVAQLMTYTNPALNPIVYFIFIERFRSGLRSLLTCTRKRSNGETASARAASGFHTIPLTLRSRNTESKELIQSTGEL